MDTQILNEIIISENVFEKAMCSFDETSIYDTAFPIKLLSKELNRKLIEADNFITSISNAVFKDLPILGQVEQSLNKGVRYVLDVSDTTLNAIERKRIKLTTDKSGKMFAQIREHNGHYGSKLPIKREEFYKGIDMLQMANALQMKFMQEEIESIAEQIENIDHNVKNVLKGLQNDRIGLYYSGLALFLEAQNINDEKLRAALIAQALRSLSDSVFQLTLNLQSDISYLINGEYKSAKGKQVKLIEERMQSIHQSFAFIHQANILKAGIYCQQGEISAMFAVLGEYSHFIKANIAKNANLLAQCDLEDYGTWQSRAKLRLDIVDMAKCIQSSEKILYLDIEQGE